MSFRLNEKFFKKIYSESQNDSEYFVVRPLDYPLILFSKKDGSPLASLHLKCQDNNFQNDAIGNRGRAIIAKRPFQSSTKCDFQGMINKDGQEFEFVITNLCNEGMINFNILKTDMAVKEVNPGGLNQVNELRPFESYQVQCDQNGNKVLILNSIKKEEDESSKITIKEAENEAKFENKKAVGTYYHLSVVPQINKPEMIEKFKETEWGCVDLFCLKVPRIPSYGFHSIANHNVAGNTYYPMYSDTRSGDNRSELLSRGSSMMQLCSAPSYNLKTKKAVWCSAAEELDESYAFDDNDIDIPEKEGLESFNDLKVEDGKKTDSLDKLISESFAAKVDSGRTINVYSAESGIEYNYETCSQSCVVGLSISSNLIFREEAPLEVLVLEAKELLKDVLVNSSKTLLEALTRIYKADACVICLETQEEKPLDCVMYQCGHQCSHFECGKTLSKCPMCRNHINAVQMFNFC